VNGVLKACILQEIHSSFKISRNSQIQFTDIAAAKKEKYIDCLCRLRDAINRKRPEKLRTKCWLLIRDNATARRSVLVKDFLANSNVTTLEHPPNSPDQAPADFYPFPRLKLAMKGRRICDATEIIKNAMEQPKTLSQHSFQECFQHLYRR
jgi:transposase